MEKTIALKNLNASVKVKLPNKSKALNNIIKYKWSFVMLLPGLAVMFIFNYMPMYGILMAFQNFDIVKGIGGSEWVGFLNFQKMFSNAGFLEVFRNSLLISFYRLIWGFPMPIILAIALNEIKMVRYKKLVQTSI